MTREEILRMAESVGFYLVDFIDDDKSVTEQIQADNSESLYSFAALVAAAEREKVAAWMIERDYATGHGDTIEGLLKALEWQAKERARGFL
jgi:hypothetical protein